MNCPEAKQNLWDYYDDASSPVQRRELEGHLSQCRECRASLDEWITLSKAAFRRQSSKAPAFLWTRVLSRIKEREQEQSTYWWYQWRWMSRVAAAMAVFVSLGAGWVAYQNHLGVPLENLLQGGEVSPQIAQLSSAKTPAKSEEITVAWLLGHDSAGGTSWDQK